jgi:hypothetical protein
MRQNPKQEFDRTMEILRMIVTNSRIYREKQKQAEKQQEK